MRADTVFTPLQGGAATEAATRSPGRAGSAAAGQAFADILGDMQQVEAPVQAAAPVRRSADADVADKVTVDADLQDTDAQTLVPAEADGQPQILPPAPVNTAKPGETPEVLPDEPPVTTTKPIEPQILPHEAETTARDQGRPEVLPHVPPTVGKPAEGPPVLPDQPTVVAGKKNADAAQVNPGPSTEPLPEAAEQAPAQARTPDAAAQGQQPTPAVAPTLIKRLLATHEAREAASGRSSNAAEPASGTKARETSDGATGPQTPAPAPGGATPTATAPQAPVPVARTAGEPVAPPPAQALDGGAEGALNTGGQPSGEFKLSPAVHDRNLGLSTLSRATVETTALIAAQIQNRLSGRTTRFEMALTPEGLGRVDVSLEIDSDGRLAARLAFDNPAAATELRGRADELRRQLEQAGLHLDNDALQFTERDPSSAGQGFGGFDRRAFSRASSLHDQADTPVIEAAVWQPLTLTRDRVDLKV
ncbi:flagellar hook-length control protein FliK [Brevundimonas poindexterae]|uniref:flagellar hook-length control protein FliK n=1 Tax=Brevundimonas poindexterae TaxID=74325 RepID=UPI001CFDBC6A|nr:flagellar hook-length control protein FliK [Brevundimonas poindexterae]